MEEELLVAVKRIEQHLKPIKTVAEIMLALFILGIISACGAVALAILGAS